MTENTPENRALLKIAAIRHSWELYEAAADLLDPTGGGDEPQFWYYRNILAQIVRQIQEEAK